MNARLKSEGMVMASKVRWVVRGALVLSIIALAVVALRMQRRHQPGYLWEQAVAALDTDDHATAEFYLRNLLRQAPDHVEAHIALADLYAQQTGTSVHRTSYAAHPRALQQLHAAAERRPSDANLQVKLLEAYTDAGRVKAAMGVASRLVELGSNDPTALQLLATAAIDSGDYLAAENYLDRAEEPGPLPAIRLAATRMRLYHESNNATRLDEAFSAATRTWLACPPELLAELNPTDRRSLRNTLLIGIRSAADPSQAWDRAGRALDVVVHVSAATGDGRNEPPLFEEMTAVMAAAELWHPLGDDASPSIEKRRDAVEDRYVALVQSAIDAGIPYAAMYRRAAEVAIRRKKGDQALLLLQKGIAAGAALPDERKRELLPLHSLAARRLFLDGRYAGIEVHLAPLLADDETSGWGRLIAGSVAFYEGRFPEALNHFLFARRIVGDTVPIRAALAQSYLKLGRWEEALVQLQQLHVDFASLDEEQKTWAERFVGRPESIALAEATAHLALDQYDDAAKLLTLFEGTPLEPQAVRLLVAYHVRKGEQDVAATYLAHGREAFPHDFALLLAQAEVYRRADHADQAATLVRQFAAEHPRHLLAQITLARLETSEGNRAAALSRLDRLVDEFPESSVPRAIRAALCITGGKTDQAADDIAVLKRHSSTEPLALLLETQVALANHGLGEAARVLSQARPAAQRNGLVSLWQGEMSLAQGDAQHAVAPLCQSLRYSTLRPSAARALLQVMDQWVATERLDDVAAKLDVLMTRYPQEPVFVIVKAEIEARLRHSREAQTVLGRLEQLDIDPASIAYHRARVAIRSGQFDQATRYVGQALKDNPSHVAVQLLAARLALTTDELQPALDHARFAIKMAPQLWPAYLLQAEILHRMHRDSDAVEVLEAVIDRRPDLGAAYQSLATIHADGGHPDDAVKMLRTGIDLVADAMPLLEQEVALLCTTGQFTRAKAAAASAVDKHPRAAHCIRLGRVLLRAGCFDAARGLGMRAIDLGDATDRVQGHWFVGEVGLRKGRIENDLRLLTDAHQHLATAFAAQPDNILIGNNLAWLLANDLDRPEEAIEIAAQVLEHHDAATLPAAVVDTLAAAYRKAGRMDVARRLVEQALVRNQKDPLLLYQAGMVYIGTQKHDAARKALESALTLGLSQERVERARSELARLSADMGSE